MCASETSVAHHLGQTFRNKRIFDAIDANHQKCRLFTNKAKAPLRLSYGHLMRFQYTCFH